MLGFGIGRIASEFIYFHCFDAEYELFLWVGHRDCIYLALSMLDMRCFCELGIGIGFI